MRLYPALAVFVVGLGVAACKDDPAEPRVAYRMTVQSGDGQYAEPGAFAADSLRVSVVEDASGEAAKDVSVTFRVTRGSGAALGAATVRTDPSGVAATRVQVGNTAGEYEITAETQHLEGSPARFLIRAVLQPAITGLSATALDAGDALTITGRNFSSVPTENTVLFGGIRGHVLSASPTELSVTLPACLPTRSLPVTVGLGAVRATPVSIDVQGAQIATSTLAVGAALTLRSAADLACARTLMDGGAALLLVAQNASSTIGARQDFALTGLLGNSVAAPVRVEETVRRGVAGTRLRGTAAGTEASTWERQLRERERQIPAGTFLKTTAAQANLVRMPEIGDRKQFSVVNKDDRFSKVTAEVKYVSDRAVLYQDVNAPAGGFTAQDFQNFGELFDEPIYSTDVAVFGEPSDIDGNGRISILFSPVVNELTSKGSSSFIAGFFYAWDLSSGEGSNRGEVFYSMVPDPQAKFGDARSKDRVLQVVPPVLAHELQHMIHANYRVVQQGLRQEALWLSEGLAHHAEDLVGAVFEARGDVATAQRFRNSNFLRSAEYLDNPAAVSLLTNVSPGTLAERGAAWLFIKYIYGHYGAAEVLRRITRSSSSGVNAVTGATGAEWHHLFANWALAVYADDAPELAGAAVDPLHTIPDLDLRAELSRFGFPLQPTGVPFDDFIIDGALPSSGARYALFQGGPALLNLAVSRKYGVAPATGDALQLSLLRIR